MVVNVIGVVAGRVDLPALDLHDEAVVHQEVERPVDRRRRDDPVLRLGEPLYDRVGAERLPGFGEDADGPRDATLSSAGRGPGTRSRLG